MKKQLSLNLYKGTHGGRRPNCGRPRLHSKGVAHRTREKINAHTPFHINFKYKAFIRTNKVLEILEIGIKNASRHKLKVTHYTLQSNHVHIIAESPHNESLIKGMRSLTNTIVKRIGKGSIQIERYHLHVLKTPTEVSNAVTYVLGNDIKHRGKLDLKFTKKVQTGSCWLLRTISSSKDIASEA